MVTSIFAMSVSLVIAGSKSFIPAQNMTQPGNSVLSKISYPQNWTAEMSQSQLASLGVDDENFTTTEQPSEGSGSVDSDFENDSTRIFLLGMFVLGCIIGYLKVCTSVCESELPEDANDDDDANDDIELGDLPVMGGQWHARDDGSLYPPTSSSGA